MTISEKYLRDMEESTHIRITDGQKQMILERFGVEPWPYEWSQQDIAVQIGNYLYCGHWEKPSVNNERYGTLPDGVAF